ncbi:hypothetical protein HGRIS_008278 [Hohenbuehelia grisea]|uniref:PEHE domain-containing protein n=1 Tax=Hohenbuehelia grisea TaxID=104357 RepID=A0ABR3J7Y3_9AGAR
MEKTSAPAAPSGAQTRQKRVLPSRSRRGGPGVGGCDVDQMILETYKRQAENEPLISIEAQFLLTTDVSQLPSAGSSSSGSLALNLRARERYFDRPEVIKAYKEQAIIQTPEFTSLSDDAVVGGRFRPRGGVEEAAADTSDATYEKRHRKYESFEKRVRLREKEKLKHEQYKLKERIEQLRAMDGAAFLHLPTTIFPLPPSAQPAEAPEEEDEFSSYSNSAIHVEGERRRKEMLDVALQLEDRYRVLLPPDKPYVKKVAPAPPPELNEEDDHEYEEPEKKEEKLKLKIKLTPRLSASTARSISVSAPPPPKPPAPSKARKSHAPSTPKADVPSTPRMIKPPSSAYSNSDPPIFPESPAFAPEQPEDEQQESASRPYKRMKSTHVSAQSSHARGRPPSLPPIAAITAPVRLTPAQDAPSKASKKEKQSDRPSSVLILAAMRTSSMPRSRKNQRNHTAFGTKVPQAVDEEREFELPDWAGRALSEESDDGPPEYAAQPEPREAQPPEAEAETGAGAEAGVGAEAEAEAEEALQLLKNSGVRQPNGNAGTMDVDVT